MQLYLVRHGESEANKHHLHSSPDTKLTSEGIKQAEALAKRLTNIPIDFIYASTHARTQQTADVIAKKLNLKIESSYELVEVKTPTTNWGKPLDSKGTIREEIVDEHYVLGKRKSDEETFAEIKNRAAKMLNHFLLKHRSQNILVVSHASFIKMITLVATIGEVLDPKTYIRFKRHSKMSNSGISIIEYSDEHGWVLDSWNDKSHL